MSASRHFATIAGRQVHYRRCGSGPAVLLLHQSPASSAELEPLMRQLQPRYTAIAPDMPGYGASDPRPDGALTIEWLADQVAALMDEIGLATAAVYGFHTGASVAAALARRHPGRVSVAVCEGLLCLDGPERAQFLHRYIEPFVPRFDGGHLAWLWTRLKDQSLFFPWYERSGAARLELDGSTPDVLAVRALDWLRSGSRCGDGYAAAFKYDPRADLPFVRTPLKVRCHVADPLAAHLARLPPLPANIEVQRFSSAREGRDLLERALLGRAGEHPAPAPVPARPPTGRVWQDYVRIGGAHLRVLRSGDATGRPTVLQHDACGSLRTCTGMVAALGRDRPVLAVELPGHGESDWPDGCDADGMVSLAEIIGGALRELGAADCDLIGWGAGAALQVELARCRPALRASLSLMAALDATRDPPLQETLLASYAAPAADFSGAQLLRAWHEARDHLLFFPWYERRRSCAVQSPRLEPEFLHARTVDALLAGAAGVAVRRAEIRYPLLARCREAGVPPRHGAPEWEPRLGHSRALAPSAQDFAVLSGDPARCVRDLAALSHPETP